MALPVLQVKSVNFVAMNMSSKAYAVLVKFWLLVFAVTLGFRSQAQSYSFLDRGKGNAEIMPINDGLYCLYKTSDKKQLNSEFRKVFLNADLRPYDSVKYFVEGNATLLASCSNEKFITHAFYTKTASVEKIVFIVTDHFGRQQYTFFKTALDLSKYFEKPLKKLKSLQLSFVPNNGSPEMLLIKPSLATGSTFGTGRFFALNSEDGKELWVSNAPPMSRIQTTEKLLIGLTTLFSSNGFNTNYSYTIHFVDKSSGQLIKSIQLANEGKGYRAVSVFASNGVELMLAGSAFEANNTKEGKFFMTMFNLSGEKIFDRVDSAARLSTRRMHLMGNVFDQNGDLILISESWKLDATRAIASTAGSILVGALLGGPVYTGVNARLDHKIDHLNFATLSPIDGSLKKFKSFPVGPWLSYGRLMTEGSHILLIVSGQVISYDANDPNAAPAILTTLKFGESILTSPSGPIVMKMSKGIYTLSRVR